MLMEKAVGQTWKRQLIRQPQDNSFIAIKKELAIFFLSKNRYVVHIQVNSSLISYDAMIQAVLNVFSGKQDVKDIRSIPCLSGYLPYDSYALTPGYTILNHLESLVLLFLACKMHIVIPAAWATVTINRRVCKTPTTVSCL